MSVSFDADLFRILFSFCRMSPAVVLPLGWQLTRVGIEESHYNFFVAIVHYIHKLWLDQATNNDIIETFATQQQQHQQTQKKQE